ncbi:MAG TPA: hypothetical protein VMR86_00015, partial [Myxococcota bacterium]|nr:hypothetical protein [Myxococcota bacterium]
MMRSALVAVLLGLGTAPPAPLTGTLDALFPTGRVTRPLESLLAEHPLEAGKTFQVTELGRDAASSHHLVWIVDREQPHRHDSHDLFVVMLRGSGTMRIGSETRPIAPGSIL